MNLGYTGSRVGMTSAQEATLRLLLQDPEYLLKQAGPFHHGDCIGGDAQFHQIIRELFPDATIIIHPPTDRSRQAFCDGDLWRKPAPFLDRNRNIVDETVRMIATPQQPNEQWRGNGTWAAIRYAVYQHGVCLVINPDGHFYHRLPRLTP